MRFRVWVTFRAASQAEAHSRTADRVVSSVQPGCLSYPIESSRSCGQGGKGC